MAGDDAGDDVCEIGLRVDGVELAGLHKRGDDSPMLGAASSGTVYFEFSVRDNFVRFAANSSNYGAGGLMPTLWQGIVERLRQPFIPVIYLGNFVSQSITPTKLSLGNDLPIMPTCTDVEFYSAAPNLHPTTRAQTLVYRSVLDGERFV